MKNQLAERMLLRQLIEARDRAMQPWAGAKEAREQFRRLSPAERAQAVEAVAWRVRHDRRWQGPADDGRWAIPIPWRWLRDRRFEDARQSVSAPAPRAAAVVTAEHRRRAEDIRRRGWGRCQHEPPCASYAECVSVIAEALAAGPRDGDEVSA